VALAIKKIEKRKEREVSAAVAAHAIL